MSESTPEEGGWVVWYRTGLFGLVGFFSLSDSVSNSRKIPVETPAHLIFELKVNEYQELLEQNFIVFQSEVNLMVVLVNESIILLVILTP